MADILNKGLAPYSAESAGDFSVLDRSDGIPRQDLGQQFKSNL